MCFEGIGLNNKYGVVTEGHLSYVCSVTGFVGVKHCRFS